MKDDNPPTAIVSSRPLSSPFRRGSSASPNESVAGELARIYPRRPGTATSVEQVGINARAN